MSKASKEFKLILEMVWRYRDWAKKHRNRPTLKNFEEWLKYMEVSNE